MNLYQTLSVLVLLAGLLGGALACAPGDSAPHDLAQHSSFHRLELQPTANAAPRAAVQRYMSLVPGVQKPWDVAGGVASVVERDGAPLLYIRKCKNPRISIDGHFDARKFNTLAIRGGLGKTRKITLVLKRGDERLSVVQTLDQEYISGTATHTLALPAVYPDAGEFDELSLRFGTGEGFLHISQIDLLWIPDSTLLPDADLPPQLVRIDEEEHSSIGVSTDRPLDCSFEAPPNSSLCFTYGLPERLLEHAEVATLDVELSAADHEPERHSFLLVPEASQRWQSTRLSLERFAGGSVRAQWSVRGPDGAACLLSETGVLEAGLHTRRVLLITSDTHRSDHLGVARRGVDVRTPALDALAARGILFEDCFSSTNITNPSHIALMTATHPRDIGILFNNEQLSRAAPTLAEGFRSAGFVTYASNSANHLADGISGLGQGFDRYSSPWASRTREAKDSVDIALDWMPDAAGMPLFLWLHVFDAHTPYAVPDELVTQYYGDAARAFDPALPELPGPQPYLVAKDFDGLRDLEYPKALYRAEVTYLDAELQRLLGSAEFENAVVGFTADHGESLGEHELYYTHSGLYPASIHVPMILSFPGAPLGVRVREPVRQIDLGRTLLDLAGCAGVEFPGTNLLEALEPAEGDARARYALSVKGQGASITLNGWHLMFTFRPIRGKHVSKPRENHSVLLFHLPEDPHCEVNLALSEMERARDLRRMLLDWIARTEDRGWHGTTRNDAGTLRDLEALGYAGGSEGEPEERQLYDPSCDCDECARFAE